MNGFGRCAAVVLGNTAVVCAVAVCMLLLNGCAPQPKPAPMAASRVEVSNQAPKDLEHTIQFSGETLAVIAAWYTGKATNWTQIQRANPGLRPERLHIGQTIIVPGELVVRRDPLGKNFPKTQSLLGADKTAPPSAATEPSATEGVKEAPLGSTEQWRPLEPLKPEASAAALSNSAEDAPVAVQTQKPAITAPLPAAAFSSASASNSEDREKEKLLDELLK